DALTHSARHSVSAAALLRALLDGLGSIWRGENAPPGAPQGDVWRHPHAGGSDDTAGWVPFHKLSQWLAYSLFEPFEWLGRGIAPRAARTPLTPKRHSGGCSPRG